MAKKINSKMKFTAVVQKFLDESDWSDEIEIDEKTGLSQMASIFLINDQSYKLFIDANEPDSIITLTLYSPINVPSNCLSEVCMLLCEINARLKIGRFTTIVREEPGPIQYVAAYDMEGGTLAPKMLENMLSAGNSAIINWIEYITKVALTKSTALEVLKEIDETEQK